MKKHAFFSFADINNFELHINQSIPWYEILNKNIELLSTYFIEDSTNFIDIWCSTWKLLRNINKRINKRNVKYIWIEVEKHFEKSFKKDNDTTFINTDILNYSDFNNTSFITSVFTFQFLEIKNRKKILKNVYNWLNRWWAFVFCEKIYSKNAIMQDIITFLYYDFKKQSFSSEEILDKEKSLRWYMKPLTLEDNIEMLKSVDLKLISYSQYCCFFS